MSERNLTTDEILEKMRRVEQSCKTIEQKRVSDAYRKLGAEMITKLNKEGK